MTPCRFLFLIPALLAAALPLRAADTLRDRQVGYFLFNKTADEESEVHLITLAKTTPPDVVDYVKRVSENAGRTLAFVEKVEDRQPGLKLGDDPLPRFERDVRQSIREDKQHNLLFGTTDVKFARALLFSQVEATNYLMHMAKVLAQDDPAHARELTRLSASWQKLRDEGVRLSAGR